ncbi:MAG: D-alanine--D-alanine ligase, partial [Clostridiaceae bacterium]|nr:D-alanine--D-alanine ligase [Clostridiaceae bacterium]
DYLYFTRKEIGENADSAARKIEDRFNYPVFVKPSNAGSSVGVSKARDKNELMGALNFAAKYDRKVLVEEFINGRELECAVLGNDSPIASAVGEIVSSGEFYDYRAKYIDNKSKVIIPAGIPEETANTIRDYAVKAFKALDCAGLSRVDFFVHRETGKVYINEINTIPGFTNISMYPMLWEASGIPYPELIERLLELAIERFEDNTREIDC